MKKLKAFTLIETLIVIIVFCIGILVVLQGLSQTLRNKDYANTQIKSAFFAREGIELLFNLRDANYHKELPWNCIFKYNENGITINLDSKGNEISNSACDGYLGSGDANILKIGIGSGNEYVHIEKATLHEDFEQNLSGFQIYFHSGNVLNGETGFRYDYVGNEDEKTGFARYLLITGVVNNGEILPKDKILKVESHVLYQRGAITGEKVMETFIGEYEFKQDVLF